MKSLKEIIHYVSMSLMILSCIYAAITIFAIIITSGWSSDTAITFEANVWYICSIIIAAICIILYFILKNRLIILGGNVIISILFLVAEDIIRKNPYATRPEWFIMVDVLPLLIAVVGISIDLLMDAYRIRR